MKLGLTSTLAAVVFGCSLLAAGSASAKEELLGSAVYELKPQRDVVKVGVKEGTYKSIRLEVKGSDVEVLDLKIVYGSGAAEDIRVRQTFKAGSSSRAIDLSGRQRAIKEIVVTYVAPGPARINFYGDQAAQASWERLGCQNVNFGIDRDVIRVGRKEGAFSAIRLAVRQAPIEIYDLKVVFGNGRSQAIRLRSKIPAGSVTGKIDLKGDERGIDRVEMIYRSIPTFKGKAEVCVDGLQR